MNRFLLVFTTAVLALLGGSLFLYKYFVLNFPIQPGAASHMWVIEAHLSFFGKNKPVKASLNIPRSTKKFLIMDESFVSRGYGLTTKSKESNRYAEWSTRKAPKWHQQGLYYRAVVRMGTHQLVQPKVEAPDTPEKPEFHGLRAEAANALLAEVQNRSADTESLVSHLIRSLNRSSDDQNLRALLGKRPTTLQRAQMAVLLLAELRVPARVVHGLSLEVPTRSASFEQRLEVYYDSKWRSFDLRRGREGTPRDFLPWWYGDQPLAYVRTADRVRTSVSVDRIAEDMMSAVMAEARMSNPALLEYSLYALPIETQSVYRIILLVPLGAFLVVILRNIIGVMTFGTFMPVLIALAFRETELLYGVVLFTALISLGLLARFYLEHLKLLLIPRVAAVLTFVVLLMLAISLLTHKLGIERGLSVALFPMVIVAMTIERMSIVWDELGPFEAIKQGIGSVAVAAIIYGVIANERVQHIAFSFPELILVLLAVIILLGRYRGFRLFELYRFRSLMRGVE